ncbi:protein-tyrosine-phosphatase [Ameyamaea chiangmaiensis NBRC 103196]|uniref:protein-tyrosine-phosphatase n=1 Tax=Ameyamaea chiangmaiensis TaxID=442969 RepID=A0A850PHB5_9PROT|nr:low molecular weight protein-tyrosine-phosphatase [Ameyamaea chiangmaiensis]MBS4075068.1 low molecular weight phosphotyrosine protein phosphatase [Ameyamaea chiangmaiensis]NVN41636.1 low molecular weight phosphotyrosine protein phosphatase [Ameyamaea chiangmaiensis]GBQ65590.1 protein-tyrosine-phosphatase [Ameyamaea chiangmaiensis NBRC 103196]
MVAVLFVCTGNICRSPLAEAALRDLCAREGLDVTVDSAGTGRWHIGDPPDRRARAVAREAGLTIDAYQARVVTPSDFERFTHIVALDRSHLAALRRMAPAGSPARVSLLLDHVAGRAGQDVADPYYGTLEDFRVTWRDVRDGADALLPLLRQAP